ncbi:MAG: hypothetical protein GXY65_11135 [Rhodococcus sp.]|uniref:hypothetical protein n=1 Tax=Rhodococcus TaxID=1827 RepID=UPI0016AFE81C|nr:MULTISPECIES: hypothetical protein [Rhodococcus]NLV79872.1 hypothetical protein [Rhodococcus sp. (in: high G+C Gram-positive bacteria)]
MPTGTLLERYEDHRARRFLRNEELTAGWLPGWRNRKRRRILACAVVALLIGTFSVSVASYFTMTVAIAWIPLTLLFLPVWTGLQIVSGRQSDAPRLALDEREIAERNSARSIGLSVAQSLLLLPIFALIFGSVLDSVDHRQLAYSAGGFALASILFSGCLPAVLLAWNQPDDDPED